MYMSFSKGIEYLEIPKAACSSFKVALYEADGYTADEHSVHYLTYWNQTGVPRFRFTFVRHPIDRFISLYLNKIVNDYYHPWRRHYKQIPTPSEFIDWLGDYLYKPHVDLHVQLQSVIRDYHHNAKSDDYIGHLETVTPEWAVIQQLWSLPALKHLNRSTKTLELTKTELDKLYKLYQPDFDRFGYTL